MFLAVLFFITAVLYACVGFGGGSTYNALLILNGVDYRILPFIALTCNIIVVSGGVWHFARHNHIKVRQVLPWVMFSIPAAWLGGYITISEILYTGVLGGALLLSGIKMLWPEKVFVSVQTQQNRHAMTKSAILAPVIGASLGFLAGITGIGGGIFLAPVLHLLRWSDSRNIAGTCSLFILVNSLSGLIGQAMKLHGTDVLGTAIMSYWYLFPTVLIGGQIGSVLGASRINVRAVKNLTALLILYVAVRLLWRFVTIF